MKPQARPSLAAIRSACTAILMAAGYISPNSNAHGQTPQPTIETANELAGVKVLEPGKWGSVRTVAANRSDHDSVPLIIVGFAGDPLRQFCTQTWLPPMSRRDVLTPVLPQSEAKPAAGVEIITRLLAVGSQRPGEPVSGRSPLTQGRFDTAIIAADDDPESMALVGALRKSAGLKPTTILLKPRGLPISAEGYEAIDSVFLRGKDLDLDPPRRSALVQFVERGGRLWVMLDEADPSWPLAILGDRWDLCVLDTVEVTKFAIQGPGGSTPRELDHGARLLRVCAPTFEATHTIDSNPAALRKAIGRGQLVVTTLSPAGWLEPGGAATPALADLQAFVAPSEDRKIFSPSEMRIFDQHVQRSIGYRILDRGTVVPVLASSLAIMLAAAFWASRRRRLELAAPVSVACALVSGVVLIGLGRGRQTQTASTAATDQFILVSAETGHAEALARSSVYITPGDELANAAVKATRGGAIVSDRTRSGSLERTVWSDPQAFEIQGLDLRPGAALNLTTHVTAMLPTPPRATISADAAGVFGRLELGGAAVKDMPLLVTAAGVLALQLDDKGTLRAVESGTPAPGSYAPGSLLSEEEISRQRVCRELFGGSWFPVQPSILLWSDPVDLGVQFPVPAKGQSLLMIPVTFEAPAARSLVSIPSPLMNPEPLRRSFGGRPSAAIYDPVKRSWLGEIHQPKLVMMQFRPPEVFGPLAVDSARLTLDLRAPGYDFDVVIMRAGTLRVVGGGASPTGRVVLDLAGEDAPQMEPDGGVLIGVDIKGAAEESDGRGWSIQRMDLSIRGRTP